MIEVPIDKIVPLDEALGDINKLIESARNEKTLYVLTKDGKPYAAIIDIDYLEHLPELEGAGETKPIHEIGKEETPEKAPEETATPEETEAPPAPSSEQEQAPPTTPEKSAPESDSPSNDVYGENIGPWQKPNDEGSDEEKPNEPPDLPIG